LVFFARHLAFLRILYALPHPSISPLYAPPSDNSLKAAQAAPRGASHMNMLDGLSLLLAVALAIYLLVALLRADRS